MLKKTTLAVCASLLLLAGCGNDKKSEAAPASEASQAKSQEVTPLQPPVVAVRLEKVSAEPFKKLAVFQDEHFQIIKAMQINGNNYIVHGIAKAPEKFTGVNVFVTQDMKHVSVGRIMSTNSKDEITIELDKEDLAVVEKFKEKYKKASFLKDKELAPVVYGTGTQEYLLFTDPDCPYCKRLEETILAKGLKEDVKLYVFPMHLNIRGHSTQPIEYTISLPSDKRAAAFSDYLSGKDAEYKKFKSTQDTKKKLDAWLQQVETLATEYQVRGTPSIVDQYGTNVNFNNILK